ncbi:uncharacterized protein [Anolis sagrei]|uniref:uncharacterized protein n=1 Tax=Anolis sagrei TaxID=38937 RepID=UPI0035201A1E
MPVPPQGGGVASPPMQMAGPSSSIFGGAAFQHPSPPSTSAALEGGGEERRAQRIEPPRRGSRRSRRARSPSRSSRGSGRRRRRSPSSSSSSSSSSSGCSRRRRRSRWSRSPSRRGHRMPAPAPPPLPFQGFWQLSSTGQYVFVPTMGPPQPSFPMSSTPAMPLPMPRMMAPAAPPPPQGPLTVMPGTSLQGAHTLNVSSGRGANTVPPSIHDTPPLPMLCEGELQLTDVQPDTLEGQEPGLRGEDIDNYDSAPDSPDLAQAAGTVDETMDRSPDFNKFASLVSRMIKALDLPAPKPSEHVEDPMFPSDEQNIVSPTALPPLPYLLKLARVSDVAPPLVAAVPRRVDALYKIDLSSAKWVSNPPRPNTVVAEVAKAKRQKGALTTPPDREGRKVDALGRKAHLSAGLFTRMSHFATYMSGYQKFLWEQILPYLDSLPPDSQRFPKALQEEAVVLARFQKDFAKHLAEAAGNLFAIATSIRRHAWLRAANLSEEGKALAEDLPLHVDGLFNPETDEKLKSKQEVRQAASKFGYSWQPSSQSKPRWQQQQSSGFRRNYSNSFTGPYRNRNSGFSRFQSGRRAPYGARSKFQSFQNKPRTQPASKKRV